MSRWLEVAKVDDIDENAGQAVVVEGRLIALFRIEGKIHAIDDCCPHAGAPLSEGHVADGIVTCPWHAWRFRIDDGIWADAPQAGTRVNTYPIKIEGDKVLLEADW
ncbi:Naphthalene 1,2-dioxygenase system ferredoxin subunit [Planctomycetes bacterium Pan216]|uniref:Naphthalene 1,2-dioxygenase system ferredoxin subunit n=1 Tax=Kolteria novifilia TaxID=2527975 RepID=A0A518BB33_9BACT|nr:Naphthalene 1,2-dioxygenase system ferredoxin subunit [Planctomycetes bacterium Pan216]